MAENLHSVVDKAYWSGYDNRSFLKKREALARFIAKLNAYGTSMQLVAVAL